MVAWVVLSCCVFKFRVFFFVWEHIVAGMSSVLGWGWCSMKSPPGSVQIFLGGGDERGKVCRGKVSNA
eukprot:1336468-Pleurochrysis_carterae.AAC.1